MGKGNGDKSGGSRRDDSYFAADRRKKKKYIMFIVPAIVAVVAIGIVGALLYQPPQVLAISGVECHPQEVTTYHVHAHLDVFVDGRPHEVPARIGILSSPSCLFWLHTHDVDGLIHIEAPRQQNFTLGQFLDIWSQTHSGSKQFFDSVSGKPVTVYVDGAKFDGNYRDVQLESRRQIVLAYGAPPAIVPAHDFGNSR
jgi:hypothetical protein